MLPEACITTLLSFQKVFRTLPCDIIHTAQPLRLPTLFSSHKPSGQSELCQRPLFGQLWHHPVLDSTVSLFPKNSFCSKEKNADWCFGEDDLLLSCQFVVYFGVFYFFYGQFCQVYYSRKDSFFYFLFYFFYSPFCQAYYSRKDSFHQNFQIC